jgi:hypothetical protein
MTALVHGRTSTLRYSLRVPIIRPISMQKLGLMSLHDVQYTLYDVSICYVPAVELRASYLVSMYSDGPDAVSTTCTLIALQVQLATYHLYALLLT